MTSPVPVPFTAFKTQLNAYYLGVPGAMQTLRIPDLGVSGPLSRGEVTHDLISGGTAVTRRVRARRTYTLGFSGCTPDTAQTLVGFYVGDYGDGPFCFVDPAWRNQLRDDTSTFGARAQAISGWALSNPGAETVNFTSAVTPFEAPSGVALWAGAGNGSRLGTGTFTGGVFVPDTAATPPYLSDRTTPVRVYVRTASSTASISLRGLAVAANGTVASTTTTTATATTAWQAYTAVIPISVTAAYVVIDVLCNTASAPNLYLSCADVQYGVTTPAGWAGGVGVPRVVVSAGLPSSGPFYVTRDHALQLAEI